MKKRNSVFQITLIIYLLTGGLFTAHAERYDFDDPLWEVTATESEVVSHLGQKALKIKGGTAHLKDLQLLDGVVEFDVSVARERGFMGALFRAQDMRNLEHFYIRPHQTGNVDANQYTPVYNGVSAWQLYHGEGFGVSADYRFDRWMHIKIVFAGDRAEVYIDSDEPVMTSTLKRQPAAGLVGLNSSGFSTAYFANFEVSELPEGYTIAASQEVESPLTEETVSEWLVSSPFDGQTLNGVLQLSSEHESISDWDWLSSEAAGITNLAKLHGLEEDKNTVFAKLQINADKEQLKGLSFGYSDTVAVYVNGRLFYTGYNTYESRDYRYLGTIGLFQKIYLPLQAGENEVLFAVGESFGGWGIQAQFDDMSGITLTQSSE